MQVWVLLKEEDNFVRTPLRFGVRVDTLICHALLFYNANEHDRVNPSTMIFSLLI